MAETPGVPHREELESAVLEAVQATAGADPDDVDDPLNAERAEDLARFAAWIHIVGFAAEMAEMHAQRFADRTDQPYGELGRAIGISRQAAGKRWPNLAGRAADRRTRQAWAAAHEAEILSAADLALTVPPTPDEAFRSAMGANRRAAEHAAAGSTEHLDLLDSIVREGGWAADAARRDADGLLDPGTPTGQGLTWLTVLAADRASRLPSAPAFSVHERCGGEAGCPRRVEAWINPPGNQINGHRCVEHAAADLRAGRKLVNALPDAALTSFRIAFPELAQTTGPEPKATQAPESI